MHIFVFSCTKNNQAVVASPDGRFNVKCKVAGASPHITIVIQDTIENERTVLHTKASGIGSCSLRWHDDNCFILDSSDIGFTGWEYVDGIWREVEPLRLEYKASGLFVKIEWENRKARTGRVLLCRQQDRSRSFSVLDRASLEGHIASLPYSMKWEEGESDVFVVKTVEGNERFRVVENQVLKRESSIEKH